MTESTPLVFDPMKLALQREREGTLIYHYTDFAGLKGIVEAGELWLTDARFQNDSKEVRAFLETAEKMLKQRNDAPTNPHDPFRQALSPGWEYWMFTCSFSKARNLLSQWRGYTNRGGVSIGFCRAQIESAARSAGFELKECIYHQHEKNKLISECFDQVQAATNYLRWNKEGGDSSTVANELRREILRYATRAKPYEYIEEQEVRLFKQIEALHDGFEFRLRGHRLVPFTKFKLDTDPIVPSSNRLGIAEIVVWPGDSRDMAAVSMFLGKHKLSATVINSLSSHRTD